MLPIWHVQQWVDGPIDLLLGTEWGETEVSKFQNEISRIHPMGDALLDPSHVH